MTNFLDTPLFGVLISIAAFEIGLYINKKTKMPLFNPLLIAITLIILFLLSFNIDIETYSKGGNLIYFFLGPSTVILAVPLYKQLELLKKNALPILAGITVGSITGMITIFYMSKLFNLSSTIGTSLIPKSITTPIGIEVSKQIGGIPSVTVAAIILTGILGSIIGPYTCKVFGIKNPVAIGVALGTASHAIGTTKALELGETQGAMSSLSIGIAGLITVFLAPILIKIL